MGGRAERGGAREKSNEQRVLPSCDKKDCMAACFPKPRSPAYVAPNGRDGRSAPQRNAGEGGDPDEGSGSGGGEVPEAGSGREVAQGGKGEEGEKGRRIRKEKDQSCPRLRGLTLFFFSFSPFASVSPAADRRELGQGVEPRVEEEGAVGTDQSLVPCLFFFFFSCRLYVLFFFKTMTKSSEDPHSSP